MKTLIAFTAIFAFATLAFGKDIETIKKLPTLRKSILDTLKVDGSEIAVILVQGQDAHATGDSEIYIRFFPEDAPNTVKNFVMLANLGFYDGLTFHRVVKEPKPFVAQGGDPAGDGTGGPGYHIDAEFNKQKHLLGAVAMARSTDPNSAGCQFYICLAPTPFLDNQYTVFGQVIKGMDVVKKIKKDDVMQSVRIEKKTYKELQLLCKGMPESVLYLPPVSKSVSLPGYPEKLLDKNLEGTLFSRILVDKRGEVQDVKVISSEIGELNEDVLTTIIKTWVFEPAKISGAPAADWISIPIQFTIKDRYEAEVRALGEVKKIDLR
jgi:TonB family protein